ncbi:coiled-coil domain-containing protein 57 [Echinops telfairi]|uniref:Coiled-coil domain-containing protein 57 n=1 Tax=Echinops telfairi TaxID=9371 RepID=A0AC55DUQ2_ECHTE|nr:coiled-coil domain-containing protein 57 [Echinops telfairi]
MHAHLLQDPGSGVSSAPQAVSRAALEGASGESGRTQLPPVLPEGLALEELLARKEEEWRSLQARRAQLQGAALGAAQGQLRSLREDFLYNLQLLEERDRELEHYDAVFAQARLQEQAREAEASELRIEVAKLRQALAHETRRSEELQQRQRQTLQEHRWELERLHSDKDAEITRHREQCEQLRGKLEQELQGRDGELALQKQALMLQFEAELQKREHASSLQANAMSHTILTQELKVRTGLGRHDGLDRLARERDGVLAAVKEAHAEQLRALETRVQELQAHCRSLETQLRQAEGVQADAARDHNATVARLREEALALRSGWDAQVAQLSQEAVSRDLQIHALHEEGAKLKVQAAQLQQDIDGYKRKLAVAVGREQSLEREKVQLELDWRHRCEDAERDQYRRSEDLVQSLAAAREQVAARLQEAEQRLCDKDEVLKAMALERDQAVQALKTHGLLPERETQTCVEHREEAAVSRDSAWREVQRLQEQNASLRSAVAQMRKEMEALSDQLLPAGQQQGKACETSQPAPNNAAGTPGTTTADAAMPDYVLALEAEIQSLKHKFKTLEDQLGGVLDPPQKSSSDVDVLPSIGATEDPVLQEAAPVWLHREAAQVRVELSELGQQAAELEKHLSASQKEGGETARRTWPPAPETTTPRGQGPAGGEPSRPSPELRLGWQLSNVSRRILRLQQRKEQPVESANRRGHPPGMPPGPIPARAPEPCSPGEVPARPGDVSLPLGQVQPRLTAQVALRCPEHPQAQLPYMAGSPRTQRSPSETSGSLQDTWKLLELGSSPSGPNSQDDSTPAEGPAPEAAGSPGRPQSRPEAAVAETRQGQVAVEGKKLQAQPKPRRPPRSPARPRGPNRPPRIRNYSVRD